MEKIYSILFIMACTVIVNGCPTVCRCSGTIVNCYSKSLTTVPRYNKPRYDIPRSTTVLYLNKNSITRIDANAFDGLSALRILTLNNNQISTLAGNLFRELTALQYLFLHNNRITTVELNLFRGLTALEWLNLENNTITTLDINIFKDCTALTTLYLGSNPLDCSKCELKKLKEFQRNLVRFTASCDNNPLMDHNFTNCKAITTEHRKETSTVSQQQTSLIITSTELTTEHREETSTVSQKQTTLIITIAESETTESFQSSAGTDTPASTSESTSGIINTEVIIYLSCGVGFILLLSFSMACFYVGKKYQNNQNIGINQIVDTNNRGAELDSDAQRSPTVSTGRGSGYGYAEIDELELSEFILTPPEQLHIEQDDTSSDSYDRISPPSNDYLNPYQSLLPSLQQSGNDHNNSDEYSHPDEENTAYTNLYQPIRFNRLDEFRQYASCSSVHYFEVLDDPIENTNDVNMLEDSKRRRKTW